jgi:hypothetical protein
MTAQREWPQPRGASQPEPAPTHETGTAADTPRGPILRLGAVPPRPVLNMDRIRRIAYV